MSDAYVQLAHINGILERLSMVSQKWRDVLYGAAGRSFDAVSVLDRLATRLLEIEVESNLTLAAVDTRKKCECGAGAVGGNHSSWCPIGKGE